MNGPLRFIVPGPPQAQERARFTVMPRGRGLGVRLRGQLHYRLQDLLPKAKKADRSDAARQVMREAAEAAMREQGIEKFSGPVRLSMTLCFACPKPWPKTFTRPATWHAKRPDRDNLEKLVDALQGLVWNDDAQVCCGPIEKVVLPSGEAPFTLVEVDVAPDRAEEVAEEAMRVRRELEGVHA